MANDETSNVYPFPTALPASDTGRTDVARGDASDTTADEGRLAEMTAILSCLEYLYSESVRLEARLGAHLIGAAAESMRTEISRARDAG
jgi:hypothetical protein